jgi:hypothetical protein
VATFFESSMQPLDGLPHCLQRTSQAQRIAAFFQSGVRLVPKVLPQRLFGRSCNRPLSPTPIRMRLQGIFCALLPDELADVE